jgi:hypothetical protein
LLLKNIILFLVYVCLAIDYDDVYIVINFSLFDFSYVILVILFITNVTVKNNSNSIFFHIFINIVEMHISKNNIKGQEIILEALNSGI